LNDGSRQSEQHTEEELLNDATQVRTDLFGAHLRRQAALASAAVGSVADELAADISACSY